MTDIIKVGNSEYRRVRKKQPYRRRYSPRRDSGFLFKSPAQKAYESRKNLEHIRNTRHLENERAEYKKEQAVRKAEARERRRQRIADIKSKGKALYNKDVHLPKFLRRKKKEPQPALPYKPHPYGGFESARKQE